MPHEESTNPARPAQHDASDPQHDVDRLHALHWIENRLRRGDPSLNGEVREAIESGRQLSAFLRAQSRQREYLVADCYDRASDAVSRFRDNPYDRNLIRAEVDRVVHRIEREAARPLDGLELLDADLPLPDTLIGAPGVSGAVLTVGEMLLLSGPGGAGKSTLALQLSLAAAAGAPWGSACGIEVRGSPVVFATAEDRLPHVRHRLRAVIERAEIRAGERGGTVALDESARRNALSRWHPLRIGPMVATDRRDRHSVADKTAEWDRVWSEVDRVGARLLVLDPASEVFQCSHNAATEVRWLARHLRRDADKRGCGILTAVHPNRAGRKKGADDVDRMAAGSAQWGDASRGVLVLEKDTHESAGDRDFLIRCLKSNYGQAFWRQCIYRERDGFVWHARGGVKI